MTGLYGTITTVEDVRLATVEHLRTWSGTYIAEIARQKGADLGEFRGYSTVTGDIFPICLVACAGTSGAPEPHGDGTITAPYAVAAAAVVSGLTRDEATAAAGYYGAAIQAAILQHPSLGDFAIDTSWDGTAIEEVAWDITQSIMACVCRFTIIVPGVLNTTLGPLTPPVTPGNPAVWPTVITADATPTRAT